MTNANPPKNQARRAPFQKNRTAPNILIHRRKSKPFDFAAAMAITAPHLALSKGRRRRQPSMGRVRFLRAELVTPLPGGLGITDAVCANANCYAPPAQ